MINGKRIAVVMPAYNAEKTLEMTVRRAVRRCRHQDPRRRLQQGSDRGSIPGPELGRADLCPRRQLRLWPQPADLLPRSSRRRRGHRRHGPSRLPVHPSLVPAMAGMVASGVYDMVLGSRILGAGALKGGMPLYKYIANRLLTAFQNLFSASSSPSTTPASAPSRANCWRPFRCSKTPTISSSTTR
jgi:hypothetical protein